MDFPTKVSEGTKSISTHWEYDTLSLRWEYHTYLTTIYPRERKIYSILRTILPGPEPPLANKLLTWLMSTMAPSGFGPLPWPVKLGHPNLAHQRHPHTMGNDACTWFGVIPSCARVHMLQTDSILFRYFLAHQNLMVHHPNVNIRALLVYYFSMLELNSAFVSLVRQCCYSCYRVHVTWTLCFDLCVQCI